MLSLRRAYSLRTLHDARGVRFDTPATTLRPQSGTRRFELHNCHALKIFVNGVILAWCALAFGFRPYLHCLGLCKSQHSNHFLLSQSHHCIAIKNPSMLESPGDGRVKSGRLGTRQDAGIIHNDDYHFPPPNDDKITTTMESETEDEYTDIPDTPWTACMPIDTNSFKFVKQFEWPSSFSISPPQRQKPRWDKVRCCFLPVSFPVYRVLGSIFESCAECRFLSRPNLCSEKSSWYRHLFF